MTLRRLAPVCGAILALTAAAARAANDGRADPDLLIGALRTYPSVDEARRACGPTGVVWADRYSGYFYNRSEAKYGATNDGSYACEPEARTAKYWSTDPRDGMDGHPGRTFPFDPLVFGS